MDTPSVPTGTATFLFTDVVGSTRLWEGNRAAMEEALAIHDEIMKGIIQEHQGSIFSTGGDGYAVVFGRTRSAAQAAVAMQRQLAAASWPEAAPIQVRIGFHVGEAQERDGDYFGTTVNRSARIMSVAVGGQILLSRTAADILAGQLDGSMELKALGRVELKGISRPDEVVQLTAEGLEDDFGPLTQRREGNLRVPAGQLFGRTADVADARQRLADHRLVSLIGVGGVGKTRLALAAADAARDLASDGVWLVDLAPIGDGSLLAHAVATALELRPQEGMTPEEAIIEGLGDREVLIVMDNCEHVQATVVPLIGQLIDQCPAARVLATSREPLRLRGEEVIRVDVLDHRTASVDLFIDRALQADASLVVSDNDRQTIMEICRQLDGIPLAIELAAARARALGLSDILARLDDRFRLLSAGRRAPEGRHKTLESTIDWSYQMLDADEQELFARLSVFSGSFDLDAAEAIGADGDIDAFDILDILDSLVERSLVQTRRTSLGVSYRLLESLRHYGSSRLAELGSVDEFRSRHLSHYRSLAREAQRLYEGVDGTRGVEIFGHAWANLRAAVEWGIEVGDVDAVADIADSVFWYANWRLMAEELMAWIQPLVELPDSPSRLFSAAAISALQSGDSAQAIAVSTEGIERARQQGEPLPYGCLLSESAAIWYGGDIEVGWAKSVDAVTAAEEQGSPFFQVVFNGALGVLAGTVYDPEGAMDYIEAAQRINRSLNAPDLDAYLSWATAQARSVALEPSEVETLHIEALDQAVFARCTWIEGVAALGVALASSSGTSPSSDEALRAALQQLHSSRDWQHVWAVLESAAVHLSATGRLRTAGLVIGRLDNDGRGHAMYVDQRAAAVEAVEADPDGRAGLTAGAVMQRDDLVRAVLDALSDATLGATSSLGK